jgi:hypothetical protein
MKTRGIYGKRIRQNPPRNVITGQALFILVPIFSQLLFTFMGCNFSELTLSSAGHLNLSL